MRQNPKPHARLLHGKADHIPGALIIQSCRGISSLAAQRQPCISLGKVDHKPTAQNQFIRGKCWFPESQMAAWGHPWEC